MAEIKKFWIVSDPVRIDGSYAHYWEDPSIQDEEHRLAQIAGALTEGGYDVDTFVRVYMGTWHLGKGRWEKEHSKVYDDATSARADAEKRMAKARKIYEREKGDAAVPGKQASRLVARFRQSNP
jgi:hypothetical protein